MQLVDTESLTAQAANHKNIYKKVLSCIKYNAEIRNKDGMFNVDMCHH